MFNAIRNAFTNKYVLWVTVFVVYLLILTTGADVGKFIAQLALLLLIVAFSGIIYVVLGKSIKDLMISGVIFAILTWGFDQLHLFAMVGSIGYTMGGVVQSMTIAGTCIVFAVMFFILVVMIYRGQNAMSSPKLPTK